MTVNRRSTLIVVLSIEIMLLTAALAAIRIGLDSLISEMRLTAINAGGEVSAAEPDDTAACIRNAEIPATRLLGTISENSGSRTDIGAAYGPYKPVAQSMAYTGDGFAVAFTDGPESHEEGVVKFFDSNGEQLGIQKTLPVYHANGMCMTKEGKILITRQDVDTDLEISPEDGSHEEERYLPYSAAAAAYDSVTGKYIIRTGPTAVIFSGAITDKAREYSYKPGVHGEHFQDIGAGNGFFYSCHSIDKNGDNYIDIYSEDNGEYYGSYRVDYGELESCDIVNGELVILVHIAGGSSNYLHFTGIRAV